MRLTLMSRNGCPACELACTDVKVIAAEFGAALDIIDVDAACDPEILAEYGDLVPVLLIDGDQHSCWGVDSGELRAELRRRGDHAAMYGL